LDLGYSRGKRVRGWHCKSPAATLLAAGSGKYLIAHREAFSERAAKDIIRDLASNLLVQRGMEDFAMPYEQVIALEDLQQCGWKNAIADVEYRSCEGFCTKFAFCQEAKPDSKTAACFRLLANATRLWLEAENPNDILLELLFPGVEFGVHLLHLGGRWFLGFARLASLNTEILLFRHDISFLWFCRQT
jgi:hypothetical protein